MLKGEYLEKDTKISWERPLEARWVGRFHIESEGYSFPFYFLYQKHRLWGRYVRGWFYYPVWFDFSDTMIHFEKKFPPKGRLLIYYLDTFRDDQETFSPLGVMRSALGTEQVAKLLDFAGIRERPLLRHGNAVCAMTREIELHFAEGSDAPPRSLAESYADDVATFIRLIRQRVFEYDQFAAETLKFLEGQKKSTPALTDSTEGIEDILTEMRDIAREDLPKASLGRGPGLDADIQAAAEKIESGRSGTSQKTDAALSQRRRNSRRHGTRSERTGDPADGRSRSDRFASPQHVRLAEQLISQNACRVKAAHLVGSRPSL